MKPIVDVTLGPIKIKILPYEKEGPVLDAHIDLFLGYNVFTGKPFLNPTVSLTPIHHAFLRLPARITAPAYLPADDDDDDEKPVNIKTTHEQMLRLAHEALRSFF